MNIVINLVLGLQILTALVMIGLVLIQHGKGADMGASFGSGASGSLFGATGSANFLSRSTAACAAVFFVCTLYLAYSANDRPRASAGSVLDRPAASTSSVPLSAASGVAAIPGAVSSPAMLPAAPSATAAPSAPLSASGAGAIPQR
ncbi:MAG: preprotein translocase subunit SecG [Caldimonas sp.]